MLTLATAVALSALASPPAPTSEPPVSGAGCSAVELDALEPLALLGRLTAGQLACLEARYVQGGADRARAGRLVMADAWARGNPEAWEQLAQRHLAEIDAGDADLCYKLALYLSRLGPGRAEEVVTWSDRALENRTGWSGGTYTTRVYSLYKIRAAATLALWQQAEEAGRRAEADRYRTLTAVRAREWSDYAKSSGKDPATALQICKSADPACSD